MARYVRRLVLGIVGMSVLVGCVSMVPSSTTDATPPRVEIVAENLSHRKRVVFSSDVEDRTWTVKHGDTLRISAAAWDPEGAKRVALVGKLAVHCRGIDGIYSRPVDVGDTLDLTEYAISPNLNDQVPTVVWVLKNIPSDFTARARLCNKRSETMVEYVATMTATGENFGGGSAVFTVDIIFAR